MMNKTLEDYLALPYTIEITPDDGAWFVHERGDILADLFGSAPYMARH